MPKTLLRSSTGNLALKEPEQEYVTSEADSNESVWGQPPASHYFFKLGGIPREELEGPSLFISAIASPAGSNAELREYFEEMSAWNRASARSFFDFEEGLEEDPE